jgi:diguanylate cyclase (GGDEF)-like protein
MKILIAGDNPLALPRLQGAIEAMGHEVVVASQGAEAWELLRRDDIHLVISDWRMSGLDGLELCRRVRARRNRSYVFLILLTGRPHRDDRIAALEAGADDFLVQPLDPAELLARLKVAERILAMQEELRRRSADLEAIHAELESQNARLAEIAISDGLTGLRNRYFFREFLETNFSFAVRQGLPLSLVMLDVDRFKSYNDTYGHMAGDAALMELASTLREQSREHDLVARYGGEEFVLLLPATDARESEAFCARLRAAVEGRAWPLRPITASLGVSTSTTSTLTTEQLLEEADRALYHSKERGRNAVTHFREIVHHARRLVHAPDTVRYVAPQAG